MTEPERILTVPGGPDAIPAAWARFAVELPAAQAAVTIPIEVPPGRNGLAPSLQLTYGSVCGPGPFGVGWGLPLEGVRRVGERYFLERPGGGGGELVPLGGGRFRPRADERFARLDFADNKWRIRDRDGRVHQLGEIATGRWALERSSDSYGHRVDYRWEAGRLVEVRWLDHGRGPQAGFLASVLLEYEGIRCARILVRSHAGETAPIRSYHLEHQEAQNGWLLLTRVRIEGHDGARNEAVAPLTFQYAPFDPSLRRFVALSASELAALRPVDKPEVLGRERPPADFPKIPLDDARVHRVDLSGDGRADLVIVRDRSIVYWPKLADGGWGPPVRMENSPELPDFRPERVFLGDVDGDGLADLVYVGQGDVRLYINRGGKGWSFGAHIRGTPEGAVSLVALAGGMAGVLWRGVRSWLLDLTGGARPYLLQSLVDPLEGETRLTWSTFSTGLPRPVQVVGRVNQGSHTASYVYDGAIWRGGFRGFSSVERRDSDGTQTRFWFGREGKAAGRQIKQEIRQPDGSLRQKEWSWGAPAADSVYGVALTGERKGATQRFYWDHDASGQPRAELEVTPERATLTVTQWAGREEPPFYLVDRPARITKYDVDLDGAADAEALRREVVSGRRTRRILSDTLHHYDGQPFVGLPLGQIGKHGARVRSEKLAFTEEWLNATLGQKPAWLLASRPEWAEEYPKAFRAALPGLGGYARHPVSDGGREVDAWYVISSRRRYDFQEAGASARGRVSVLRDALEHDTAVSYDSYELMPAKISDPRGLSTQAAWDYRTFRPRSMVGVGGGRTAFGYSPLGRLEKRALFARPGDERPLREISYEYGPRMIRILRDGEIERVEYRDAAGRLLQERIPAAPIAFPPFPTLETPEEVKGESAERVIVREPGKQPRDSVGWELDHAEALPLSNPAASAGKRDLLGRDWSRGALDAAGSLVEERHALGALVLHAYDSAGREVRRWARDREGQKPTLRLVRIFGDSIESGLPVQRASDANLLGRLHRQYDEAGLLTHHAYDVDGNLLERTRQPLSEETVAAGPVDWQPHGNLALDSHARGLLDDRQHRTKLRWDTRGRLMGMVHPEDLAGRRRQSSWAYDRAGRMIRCELDEKVIIEHVAYDAAGQRLLVAWGSGVVQRWARDANGRVMRLRAEKCERLGELHWKSGRVLQEYWCERDRAGRITTLLDDSPDAGMPTKPHRLERAFAWDDEGRLTSASGREAGRAPDWPWEDAQRPSESVHMRAYVDGFDYRDGHLVRMRHDAGRGSFAREWQLDDNGRLERLKGADGYLSYQLDGAGRLSVESGVRRFVWDHAGRLERYRWGEDPPQIDLQFRYDGSWALKLVRRADGPSEITVRDGGFVHERGGVERNWLHLSAGDWRIASVRSGPAKGDEPEANLRCYLEDLEGSIALTVDEDGQELGREGFNALGETTWGGIAGQPFRFRGAERDPLTGLYQLDGRPYSPWLGRFADDLSELLHAAPQPDEVAAPQNVYDEPFAEIFRVPLPATETDRGIDHGERELQDPGPRHRPEPQGGTGAARRSVGQGAGLH